MKPSKLKKTVEKLKIMLQIAILQVCFGDSLCTSLTRYECGVISSKNGLITHFVFVDFSHFEVEEEGLQLSNPS